MAADDPGIPVLFLDERGGGAPPDVAVLVSGGVDSAVALHRLARAGHRPFAITMLLPAFAGRCGSELRFAGSEASAEPARELCRRLGVSHAVLDLRELFRRLVILPFADSYRSGLTPNPCARCNPGVKFGLMRRWAEREVGARLLATGHYAAVVEAGGRPRLARRHGSEKDQSYFLYRLPPSDLGRTLFPLAEFPDKGAVREEARRCNLSGAEAGDSMDVCFLPEGDYRPLVADSARPGPILDPDGKELGRHRGFVNFTPGQRRGFGIGFGKPMYVLRLEPEHDAVVIGPREAAHRRVVAAGDLVIHDPAAVTAGERVFAKVRSGGKPRPAEVVECTNSRLSVRFADEVFAPAPGQHLVLYDGEGLVLGGGQIIPE